MKTSTAFTQTTELENKGIKEAAFGIDLGTTNSGIAVIRAGRTPVMVTLEDGKNIMPSCIMWKGKEFIVGAEAYNNRYKPSAVYSIKRLMGSGETVQVSYGRKSLTMTPAEVSAEILKGLVQKAQAAGQYNHIHNVVISVPAHFNNRQIEDTKTAGDLAGLNVISILREPTAATMAYGLESTDPNEMVLVYDLGGGTFDVTAARLHRVGSEDTLSDLYADDEDSESAESVIYSVITTDGNTRLGGDDIDLEMYKIFEDHMREADIDVKAISKQDREKMILHLETLKKRGIATYTIPVNFKTTAGKKERKRIVVTEQDFKSAARVVYNKTKKIMDNVVAKVGAQNFKNIVLVGGSTKSEAIQEFLRKDFPSARLNISLNPDEAVALGAAVKAKQDFFNDMDIEVFDILPLNIGFVSSGHYMQPVIKRDTRVPSEQSMGFVTETDNQASVRITVVQGNSRLVEDCERLGDIIINDIPKRPAGEVQGSVLFRVDSDGYLTVRVITEAGTEEAKFTNVFNISKSREESQPVGDKHYQQWSRFAETLEEPAKTKLHEALSEYLEGKAERKQIVALIRELSAVRIDKPQREDDEE